MTTIFKSVFRPVVGLPTEMRRLLETGDQVVVESKKNIEASSRLAECDGLAIALDHIAEDQR